MSKPKLIRTEPEQNKFIICEEVKDMEIVKGEPVNLDSLVMIDSDVIKVNVGFGSINQAFLHCESLALERSESKGYALAHVNPQPVNWEYPSPLLINADILYLVKFYNLDK